jgi:hypothetical protein
MRKTVAYFFRRDTQAPDFDYGSDGRARPLDDGLGAQNAIFSHHVDVLSGLHHNRKVRFLWG